MPVQCSKWRPGMSTRLLYDPEHWLSVTCGTFRHERGPVAEMAFARTQLRLLGLQHEITEQPGALDLQDDGIARLDLA